MGLASSRREAMFTPQKTAALLKNVTGGEPEQPDAANGRSKSRFDSVKINVDAGDLLSGLVQAARFVDQYRRRRRLEREQTLDKTVLAMAKSHKGFVGVFDLLLTEVCDRTEAQDSFTRLQREQHCQWLCDYEDEPLYVFPAFLVRAWVCDHCGSKRLARPSEWSVGPNYCSCCGAQLRLEIE